MGVASQKLGYATRLCRRTTTPLALVLAGAVGLGLTAAPASAKTTTLHFFQKEVSQTFVGPAGTPIAPPGPSNAPVVGEQFTTTDDDYVGTDKRHAKHWTATDHLVCTITSTAGEATCDGQIAIGGSMLLAESVNVNLSENVAVPLNGGTGAYEHAHGEAISVSIGNTNNSNFTLTFTT